MIYTLYFIDIFLIILALLVLKNVIMHNFVNIKINETVDNLNNEKDVVENNIDNIEIETIFQKIKKNLKF